MPVDREAVLREARQFIVQHCTVEELQLGLTPEQLFGAMTAEEILVTVPPEQISESLTGEQIAVWLMLQQNLRGVPLEQSAARLPRQGRDKLRLYLDATPPPDPQPRA